MSLFTGAALIGAALASTAGGIAAAKMTSGASKDASKAQADAAQQALDFTKEQKAKQEAAYAPFGALGQQAATMLPGLARQAPTQGPPAPYTTQPQATRPMPPPPSIPQGMPPTASQGAPLSAVGQTTMPMPTAAPLPAQAVPAGAGQPPTGQMVTLRSPDGDVKQFPPEIANKILQMRDKFGRVATRLN